MRLPFWRSMSFERKLLVTFLILALVPTLLLVLIQSGRLKRSVDLWETPGVENALESSVALVQQMEIEEEARRDRVGGDVLRLLVGLLREEGTFDAATAARMVQARFGSDGPVGIRLVRIGDDGFPLELMEWGKSAGDEGISIHSTSLNGGEKLSAFLSFAHKPLVDEQRNRIEEGYRFYRQIAVYERLEHGKIWMQTVAIVLIAALLALLVARLLARSLSRPLSSLVEGTSRVRHGDLDVRIEPESRDEMGQLVRSFNRMTRELKEGRERLIRAERIASWAEAARRIAHEIKNPLTPITLSLHRLGKRVEVLPEEDRTVVRECLQSILEEVEALKSLAAEFSQFSRLPSPKPAPLDVGDLLRSVVPLYVEGRDVKIEWNLAPSLPRGHADRELLRRAFSNLVKNAVEAMAGEGTIAVSTAATPAGSVEVTIGDSGPGIPAGDRLRVFNPYFTTRKEGTGLGLALVDRIVHDQGGTIIIGESPLGGALFRIVLPGEALPSDRGASTMENDHRQGS